MKIVIIHEDNHGVIGVAKNVFSAITWLIDSQWLTENCDVWSKEAQEWVALRTLHSVDELVKMSRNDFNSFFEGSFYLEEDSLIDYGMIE